MPSRFLLRAPFEPAGDQPKAIEQLVDGLRSGLKEQVLMGVTGSGKTNVMSWVIEQIERPILVLSPNKTLAAQLWAEFRRLFPENAVEYFVSYYDYYQPEAYIARSDTYIEKDSSRNEEIDRMRHSATTALMTRRDVIVVASVSCIYGIGSVEDYIGESLELEKGQSIRREILLRKLTELLYERNDYDLGRLRFRVRGDIVDVVPASEERVYRVEFFGDEIERIQELDGVTGEILGSRDELKIFPASHYITPREKLNLALRDIEVELDERTRWFDEHGRLLEAQRLRQRTMFDLEMLRETGTCAGVENYSRHLTRRQPGDAPYTLLDFLPDDALVFVDESHVGVPQIGGMLGGDRSRKAALVEYGFRLPSAFDNRPLSFEEWEERAQNVIYVTATPGPYETRRAQRTAEMVVRPTGLVDPTVEVRPTEGQIDDLLAEVKKRTELGQRSLVTTLTKRFAEDLADYLREFGVKVRYLHSELDAMQRIEVLTALRSGEVDVVVGINLLREGLDLPEVAFIGILDADKEGYLRAYRSFIQIIGRAARNVEGHVVMYADSITDSMRQALDETERRRNRQIAYNAEHGITPESVKKAIYALEINENDLQADAIEIMAGAGVPREDLLAIVRDLEKEMRRLSKELQFEDAARVRDRIIKLRRRLSGEDVSTEKENDADVAKRFRGATKRVERAGRIRHSAEDRARDGMERLACHDDGSHGSAQTRREVFLPAEQRCDGRRVQLVGVAVELEHEMLLGREIVVGAAERNAGAVRDGAHRGRLVTALLEQVEGGAQDDRPRRFTAFGLRGFDRQSNLGSRCGLVRVVVGRHDDFLAKRPANHVEDEQVEEMHRAEHEQRDAQPARRLLDHVRRGGGGPARVDEKRHSAEVDQVEADDEQVVDRVGEAFLFEDGHQEGAAAAVEGTADPDRDHRAGDDVDEVVDKSEIHVYHPSPIDLNMFKLEPN